MVPLILGNPHITSERSLDYSSFRVHVPKARALALDEAKVLGALRVAIAKAFSI